MPGTPLAEAYVRVRALTDRFKPDVERGFAGLGDQFGKQFSQEASARLRDERGRFASAGQELGDAAGDAAAERLGRRMAERGAVQFGNDGAPFVAVGRQTGDEAGAAAGEAFGRRFSQDANGRWHDERGRFVSSAKAVGEEAGEAAGDGFSKGFDRKAGGSGGGRDRGRAFGRDFGDGINNGLTGALAQLGDIGQRVMALLVPSLGKLAAGFGSAATAAGGLLATLGKWGALAAGVSAVGAAAASAAGYTVELAAALAPLSGLMAGLPGVALTGAAAFSVWKLATSGLNKAMKEALAGDYEAFSEAIVDMTDKGKAFANEFWSVAGRLREFQGVVQGDFLDQFSGRLDDWTAAVVSLQPAVSGLASEFGALVRTVLDFATGERALGQFNTILGGTRDLVAAVRSSLDPLLTGFVDLGVVGNQWLAGFSGSLQNVLTTFGRWMSEISRSGQALSWLNDATVVLQQLGRLVKDVWQTFTGLLDAAAAAGGNALGVLGNLVAAMNQWVNSAQGQEILVEIFRSLAVIGAATVPVIEALGRAVGLIAPEIAKIAQVALPVMADAIDALGPAIAALGPGIVALVQGIGTALAALGPELQTVGRTISDTFSQLRPLIGALGPAIAALLPGAQAFLGALTSGLSAVRPLLEPLGRELGNVLAALGGALGALIPQVAKIALSLAPALAAAIDALGPALAAIGPGLAKGIDAIGKTFDALGPVFNALGGEIGTIMAELGRALALIIPQVAQIALALAPALANAIKALGPALAALGPGLVAIAEYLAKAFAEPAFVNGLLAIGKGLADVLVAAAPLLPVIAELAGILAQVLGQALSNLGAALGPIIAALASALEPALRAITNALNIMIPFMEPIYRAFGEIGAALITQLLPPILDLIPALINAVIPAFAELARQVQPLIPLLADLAVQFIQQVLPAILPIMPQLTDLSLALARVGIVLAELVAAAAPYIERIIGIFQHLYDVLVGHSIIPDLINSIRDWWQKGVDWVRGIVAWFGDLPGMMFGWLGGVLTVVAQHWDGIRNAISERVGQARDTISGVLDTISSRWNEAWSNARNFVADAWNGIRNAVTDGANNVLGVVRNLPGWITGALGNLGGLLYGSGASLLQGLINGMWSMFNSVWNTAVDILNRIRSLFPFSPAKEGPFSGKGWTLYSGQSLIAGFAEGVRQQEGELTSAMDQVMRAGAAALAPALPALTGPSPAPAFDGTFAAPVTGASATAAAPRVINVANINLQGVLDPSSPVSYRRMVERLREAIRELEKEEYASG